MSKNALESISSEIRSCRLTNYTFLWLRMIFALVLNFTNSSPNPDLKISVIFQTSQFFGRMFCQDPNYVGIFNFIRQKFPFLKGNIFLLILLFCRCAILIEFSCLNVPYCNRKGSLTMSLFF